MVEDSGQPVCRPKARLERRRTDGDLSFHLDLKSPQGPISSAMCKERKDRQRQLPSFEVPRGLLESPATSTPASPLAKMDMVTPVTLKKSKSCLQRRATLPALDITSEALMLARQLHLDFHEVKFVLQELRDEGLQKLPSGGLDEKAFQECLRRIYGGELKKGMVESAYRESQAADGPVNSERFLKWYRDHMFNLEVSKPQGHGQSSGLTVGLAKKYDCSVLDLEKVKEKFDFFDLDHSGYIDPYEFESMMCQLMRCSSKSDLPKGRLQRFWKEADKNGDGEIDFEEFLEWYIKYFGTSYSNGPMDAFYASFMPDVQRTRCLEGFASTIDIQIQ